MLDAVRSRKIDTKQKLKKTKKNYKTRDTDTKQRLNKTKKNKIKNVVH